MHNKKSIKRRFLSSIALGYSSSVFGIVITLILAKHLGVEGFKVVAIGFACGTVLSTLVNMGSQQLFIRSALRSSDVGHLAGLGLSRRLSLFIGSIVLTSIAFSLLFESSQEALDALIFTIWTTLLGLYPQAWYDHYKATAKQLAMTVVERILVAVFLTAIILKQYEIDTTTLASILVAIRMLSVYIQVHVWLNLNEAISGNKFTIQTHYPWQGAPGTSFFIALPLICNNIIVYGNQTFLAAAEDATELTTYALATQLMGPAIIFQGQLLRLLRRNIAEAAATTKENSQRLTTKYAGVMIAFSIGICLIIVGLSYLAPYWLNDPRLEKISLYTPLLSIWVVVVGVGKLLSQTLLEFHKDRYYLLVGLSGASLSILLAFIFVPTYGAIALAIILVVVRVGMVFSHLVTYRRII